MVVHKREDPVSGTDPVSVPDVFISDFKCMTSLHITACLNLMHIWNSPIY